jgi:hypothetical protein
VRDVFLILPFELLACFIRREVHFFHIPRAGRLLPAPLPNNLFSLENGQLHYVEQEEQEEPYLEEAEEEDVEEEEEAPEEEVPPRSSTPRTTTSTHLEAPSTT